MRKFSTVEQLYEAHSRQIDSMLAKMYPQIKIESQYEAFLDSHDKVAKQCFDRGFQTMKMSNAVFTVENYGGNDSTTDS